MDFLKSDYVETTAILSGVIGAPLLLLQIVRELRQWLKRGRSYLGLSRAHLDNVTELSKADPAYMSACVLILGVRILAALFSLLLSIMLVIAALFLHAAAEPNQLIDVASLSFLAISSVILVATLVSAKRFSDAVRRKIAPESLETRPLI